MPRASSVVLGHSVLGEMLVAFRILGMRLHTLLRSASSFCGSPSIAALKCISHPPHELGSSLCHVLASDSMHFNPSVALPCETIK